MNVRRKVDREFSFLTTCASYGIRWAIVLIKKFKKNMMQIMMKKIKKMPTIMAMHCKKSRM